MADLRKIFRAGATYLRGRGDDDDDDDLYV
jgi:hypothetical protein